MPIRDAVRKKTKARIQLFGAAGSGKTWTALLIARRLIGDDGVIVFIDTESDGESVGASEAYADKFNHKISPIEAPFRPEKFIDAINEAIDYGADAIVIDSITDEWNGIGGYLEWKEELNDKYGKDTKPVHNRLMKLIETCPVHIVVCQRAELKAVFQEGADGKRGRISHMAEQIVGPKETSFAVKIAALMYDGGNMEITKSRYPEIPVNTVFSTENDNSTFVESLEAALDVGAPPPPTKNGLMIAARRLGLTNADMAQAKQALSLPNWSEETHKELISALTKWVEDGKPIPEAS